MKVILGVMHTTRAVVKTRPEKNIQACTEFEPMTPAIPVQRRVDRALHRYLRQYFLIGFLFYIVKLTPLFEAARNGHTDIVKRNSVSVTHRS